MLGYGKPTWHFNLWIVGCAWILALSGCGKKLPLHSESLLGPAVINGSGGSRTDGANLGRIYAVTQVISSNAGGIPGWLVSDLPFTGPAVNIGQPVLDGQTPFQFNYSYPSNNYKLADAHLVIDTSRDSSDTEGIFVDGVFSGRPPAGSPNLSSPKITHAIYFGSAEPSPNQYYINWSLAHYKQGTRNTFDLDLANLLTPTTVKPVELVEDGVLPVVTGDDSPVYQAFLVLNGYTISKTALSCSNSADFTFQNVFLHNDGNSIGSSPFAGTVKSPFNSWNTGMDPAFQSAEFFFDAQIPRVPTSDVTVTQARISMRVKRQNVGSAAIVVNGVGISEAAFNRAQANSGVERWDDSASATSVWDSFVSGIPATNTDTAVTLDLVALYGASAVRDLIAQGKLNISLAGSLSVAFAQNNSSARALGNPVAGPELQLAGTYFNQVCDVPNDPTSPLSDNDPIPGGVGDETSPVISSVQVSQITANSAVILWLSDESSTSQVVYGVGATDLSTPVDSNLTTFHSVTLSGLLPYKYYYYQVRSADSNGNLTTSATKVFRTLR